MLYYKIIIAYIYFFLYLKVVFSLPDICCSDEKMLHYNNFILKNLDKISFDMSVADFKKLCCLNGYNALLEMKGYYKFWGDSIENIVPDFRRVDYSMFYAYQAFIDKTDSGITLRDVFCMVNEKRFNETKAMALKPHRWFDLLDKDLQANFYIDDLYHCSDWVIILDDLNCREGCPDYMDSVDLNHFVKFSEWYSKNKGNSEVVNNKTILEYLNKYLRKIFHAKRCPTCKNNTLYLYKYKDNGSDEIHKEKRCLLCDE